MLGLGRRASSTARERAMTAATARSMRRLEWFDSFTSREPRRSTFNTIHIARPASRRGRIAPGAESRDHSVTTRDHGVVELARFSW
jgi:hypothetical protein